MHSKACQNCKENFDIYPEDISFYEAMKVPHPTFCPDCRAQRRFMWRNERALYKRTCSKCSKPLISLYEQDVPFPVYCKECWYGDGWDPIALGASYDPTRPFFVQFKELMHRVPRLAIWVVNCTNSEYTNQSYNNKNGYLGFGFRDSEDSAYVARAVGLRNTLDATYTHHSEGVYQSVNVDKSYRSRYIEESEGVVDSVFVSNSRNAQDCVGAINVRSGSHVWMGEQLDREEYQKRFKNLDLGSREAIRVLQKQFEELKSKAVYKYAKLTNCQNSVGDHLINAKNCHMVFDGFELENARYSSWVFSSKEISDCYGMGGSQYVYEAISPEEVANTKFVHVTDTSNNVTYTDMCMSSSNLFGCVGLRTKKYCILNTEYSKEEYERLQAQIIEDMQKNPYIDARGRSFRYGEFFPYDLSPFAYNETTAQEMYPLTREEAIAKGFRWKEETQRNYSVSMETETIPDNIKNVSESITSEVIRCAHNGICIHQCTTAFRITDAEFNFYKTNHIPLPIECPNCRHYGRLLKRNPLRVWERSCMCDAVSHGHGGNCSNEFETTYAPNRPEKVYCEACYNKEVL